MIIYLAYIVVIISWLHAAAAKLLQLCPTLCDPIDGSPPGSPVPGILPARTLEWVAISFSNAWKWKVKVKSLSCVWLLATPLVQPTSLLHPWDFSGKSTRVGCHHQFSITCHWAISSDYPPWCSHLLISDQSIFTHWSFNHPVHLLSFVKLLINSW